MPTTARRPRSLWARVTVVVAVAAITVAIGGCGSSETQRTAPATASRTVTPTPPTEYGMAFGSEIWFQDAAATNRDLDSVVRLGIRGIRIPVFWGAIQRTNRSDHDWSVLDRIVDAATTRGLSVLGSIGSTPTWAAAPGATGPYARPGDRDAWGLFVRELAERYRGQITAYEIWNEPNGAMFFDPTPDPVAYTDLLRIAHQAIIDVDQNAAIVAGALGAVPDTTTTTDPVRFLSAMYAAGAHGLFDALSFHPYKYDLGFAQAWTVPDSPARQLASLRRLMVANGDAGKPIWATEYGFPSSVTSDADAERRTAEFASAWREVGFTGPIFWFTLRDKQTGSTDPENTFGVLRTDSSPKPVAGIISQLAAAPPTESADHRWFDAHADVNWGQALSPVFPATRAGAQARAYEHAVVYRTPSGPVALPAPAAEVAFAADVTPVGRFVDGVVPVERGASIFYSEATGAHIVGEAVMAAWRTLFGLATSDEEPIGDRRVRVTFERAVITWSPDDGAEATPI